MVDIELYPSRTLAQARASLESLKRHYAESYMSTMEYRAIRDSLQQEVKQLEAKEKD